MVCAAAADVPELLYSARGVKHKLRHTAVKIFSPQTQKIGVLIILYWQISSKYLPCLRV